MGYNLLFFAYSCARNSIVLISKETLKMTSVRWGFKKTMHMVNYFKNTHFDNHCLNEQRNLKFTF